jgi:hypothetical protein
MLGYYNNNINNDVFKRLIESFGNKVKVLKLKLACCGMANEKFNCEII